MRIAKFDLESYNHTHDVSGGPALCAIEENIANVGDDEDLRINAATGYVIAYALMAAFVGMMFYVL